MAGRTRQQQQSPLSPQSSPPSALERDLKQRGGQPRSKGGWGNRHRARRAQEGWAETLLVDNKIGWGVHGYKAYNPVPLVMSVPKPKEDCAKNKVIVLPRDPVEAQRLVRATIVETFKRLNLSPQLLFNQWNKRKAKELSPEDVKNGLYAMTKFKITDDVLAFVLGALNPGALDKGSLKLTTVKANLHRLVPPSEKKKSKKEQAAADAAAAVEAAAAGVKAATAAAADAIVGDGASKKNKKKKKKKKKTNGDNNEEGTGTALAATALGYDHDQTEFHRGALVEVMVGGGDDEDEAQPEQWLPAQVLSSNKGKRREERGDKGGDDTPDDDNDDDDNDDDDANEVRVRMLVGYEQGENEFDVDASVVRAIPRREEERGRAVGVNPRKVAAGLAVLCWCANREEFRDATVLSVLAAAERGDDDEDGGGDDGGAVGTTVQIKYNKNDQDDNQDDNQEDQDQEEEEVPMVYLRSLTGAQDQEEGDPLAVLQAALEGDDEMELESDDDDDFEEEDEAGSSSASDSVYLVAAVLQLDYG